MNTPDVHMRWDDLLFLHWPVEIAAMRALVPPELEIDTFDGFAWVALVPFRMIDARFRGFPSMPGLSNFYECNVRTYVRALNGDGQMVPGVWFFSLDAEHLLPVLGGNWMWSLNYIHSRFEVQRKRSVIDYQLQRRRSASERTHIRWERGEALPASEPGSIEHFLTERYWLFTKRWGVIKGGRVVHKPWPLRRARVEHLDDTLVASAGLRVQGEPIAHHSDSIQVEGYGLRTMASVKAADA